MKLLAVLLLAFPAFGDGTVRLMECKRPVCAMVREDDIDALIASNNDNLDRAEKAEARIKELESQGPKCAKVEVTEPSKNAPPIPAAAQAGKE